MFAIVLVHKLDRFSRNRYDSAIYRSKLKKNGVRVYSVLERLDDSPESIILEALLEGMSEYYSRNLSREVSKGLLENFYAGKFTGGLTPYGFSVDENMKYVINEEEAPAIRLAFSMYAKGYGYSEILKTLDEKGYRTRKGERFSKAWLNSALRNEKYHGVYVYRKQNPRRNSFNHGMSTETLRLPGGCPAIVSDELFEKVQHQMKLNSYYCFREAEKTAKGGLPLLRGITFCGECGKRMTINTRTEGRKQKLVSTYRCFMPKHVCSNREFNKKYLEDYVVMLLERHLFNKTAMEVAVNNVHRALEQKKLQIEKELFDLLVRVGDLSEVMETVSDALKHSPGSDILQAKMTKLEAEKLDLENQARTKGTQMAECECDIDADELLQYYNEAKFSDALWEYRSVVMEYVESVTVYRNHVVIRIRTGLRLIDELNKEFVLSRAEIYGFFGSRVRSA